VFFCLSAGFVFRDVARGSEPMIRFLTMAKVLTSLVVMSFIPRNIPWRSRRNIFMVFFLLSSVIELLSLSLSLTLSAL